MINQNKKVWNNVLESRLGSPLIPIVASLAILVASLVLSDIYIAGDQKVYNEVYIFVKSSGFVDGYDFYCRMLTSIEVVHYAYIYVVSGILNKDVAMALVNATIAYLAAFLLLKNGCNKWLSLSIVTTNFYLFVVYFAAERLKFGVLFYLLSITAYRFKYLRLTLEIVSVLSHVQMFALILPVRSYYYFSSRVLSNKTIITTVMTLLLIFSLCFLAQERIVVYLNNKVSFYSENQSVYIGCLKSFLFMAVSNFKSKSNSVARILAYAVLTGFVILVGGERLMIFAFGMCLIWLTKVNQGLNFPLVVINLYFFQKTIDFIQKVLTTGHGFDEY